MWQEGLKFKYQINEVLSKEFFSVPMEVGFHDLTFQLYIGPCCHIPKYKLLEFLIIGKMMLKASYLYK